MKRYIQVRILNLGELVGQFAGSHKEGIMYRLLSLLPQEKIVLVLLINSLTEVLQAFPQRVQFFNG